MRYKFPVFPCIAALFFCSLTLLLPQAAQAQKPGTDSGRVAFRSGGPDVKAIEQERQRRDIEAQESSRETHGLAEQEKTIDSQLRYARLQEQMAKRRLSVEIAAGNSEGADKAQQEVTDWAARIKGLEAQLDELAGEIKGVQGTGQQGAEGVIIPGENVEVFVTEDNSFNGRYQVRRGGYILMPAVGRIFVAGKSLSAAEAAVAKALEASQLQHASVTIEKVEGSDVATGPVIYLSGEFRNPRPFRIPFGTRATVVGVILSSGGVTEKADLTRVRVMRVAAHKGVVEEVNVQNILNGSGLASDLALSEGDVVIVPAGSANVVYLTGNIKRQGTQVLRPGDKLSAYAAILQSGGFARFADQKKVYVLRATPDGTKLRIAVNVKAIQRGQQPDVLLQGNDILVVPEKFFSF